MSLLCFSQVVEVLSNVGTLQVEGDGSQRFSDAHMRTMFAAIDVDESGYVDWFELVNFICDAIEHLEREAYIEQVCVCVCVTGAIGARNTVVGDRCMQEPLLRQECTLSQRMSAVFLHRRAAQLEAQYKAPCFCFVQL
eukprot:522875-Pelagomonas_calceolata.AAC.2